MSNINLLTDQIIQKINEIRLEISMIDNKIEYLHDTKNFYILKKKEKRKIN